MEKFIDVYKYLLPDKFNNLAKFNLSNILINK